MLQSPKDVFEQLLHQKYNRGVINQSVINTTFMWVLTAPTADPSASRRFRFTVVLLLS